MKKRKPQDHQSSEWTISILSHRKVRQSLKCLNSPSQWSSMRTRFCAQDGVGTCLLTLPSVYGVARPVHANQFSFFFYKKKLS